MLLDGSSPPLKSLMGSGTPGEASATLVVAVAAFFVGEVLDASRDLLENVWDRFQAVSWDFFAEAGKDEVDKLRASHFTFYAFDCNVALALAILLASQFFISIGNGFVVACFAIFLIIFVWNAWQLRREIASVTRRWVQQRGNH